MQRNVELKMTHKGFNLILLTQIVIILVVCEFLVSCQGNSEGTDSSIPFFPQQHTPPTDFMGALLSGKLILEKSCLRIQDNDENNYLLIWPKDYSFNVEGDSVQIKDGSGYIVVKVGDKVNVGGGEIPSELIEDFVDKTFPSDCSGPYWSVASIEK
jgi:hypothetical protein